MDTAIKKLKNMGAPVLFPLKDKETLVDFVQEKIKDDNICSEKFSELYDAYIDFCDKNRTTKLKRRAFKECLKVVLEKKGIVVYEFAKKSGIIIKGIGLK